MLKLERLTLLLAAALVLAAGLGSSPSEADAAETSLPCTPPSPFILTIAPEQSKVSVGVGEGSCLVEAAVARPTVTGDRIEYEDLDGRNVTFGSDAPLSIAGSSCSVRVEPYADGRRGIGANFFSGEGCDGFIVTARVTPGVPAVIPARGVTALSGGSRTLQGELEAKDVIGIVMVEQRMNMGWWYDWGTVFGGWKQRLTPNYNIFWYWFGPSIESGPTLSANQYHSYYYDRHKSNGFPSPSLPDTYFAGTIDLYGYSNGSGQCSFAWSWTSQYPGTYASTGCWYI